MTPDTRLSILEGMKKSELREDAFARFDHAYRATIRAWCRASGLQDADADEVTQAVLLKLWDALRRFTYDPQKGKFRGWLAALVRNAVIDHARQKQGRPAPPGGSSAHERWQQVAQPANAEKLSSEIERRTNTAELEAVARAKARVEPRSWEAFYLLTVEKWPGRQVGERLGMSVAAVYKARQRVNDLIEQIHRQILEERSQTPGGETP